METTMAPRERTSLIPATFLALATGVGLAADAPVPIPDAATVEIEAAISRAVEQMEADPAQIVREGLASTDMQRLDELVLDLAFRFSPGLREGITSLESGSNGFDPASVESWDLPEPFETNVRQFFGETLIQAGAYDDVLSLLEPALVDESLSTDPAGLVFARAVAFHAKLDKENGLPILDRLLEPASVVPERYRALARLMKQDLEDLDDNELAQTARQMRNLQQQLQRGKSGKPQQQQEQQILQDLDRLIEKLEQQQQQAQGQGGVPSGNQPLNPSEESQIGGMKGPGDVDRKPIGKSSGWGDLPEKARTEARNLINRKFPSHYRRAVEEYLKKLADRPSE